MTVIPKIARQLLAGYLVKTALINDTIPNQAGTISDQLHGCWLDGRWSTDTAACAVETMSAITLISSSTANFRVGPDVWNEQFKPDLVKNEPQNYVNATPVNDTAFRQRILQGYGGNGTHLQTQVLSNLSYVDYGLNTAVHDFKVDVNGNDHYMSHYVDWAYHHKCQGMLYHLNAKNSTPTWIAQGQQGKGTFVSGNVVMIRVCRPQYRVEQHKSHQTSVDDYKPAFNVGNFNKYYSQIKCSVDKMIKGRVMALEVEFVPSYQEVIGIAYSALDSSPGFHLNCPKHLPDSSYMHCF